MLRKIERAGLQADLASVDALIANSTEEDDPIGHLQFRERREDILGALAGLGRDVERGGTVALLFGGGPVWGSRGIDADFAAKVLDRFQRAVGAQAAGAAGPVGARGPLAQEASSRLMVTEVGRGSFGFVLEEAGDPLPGIETPAGIALDQIAQFAKGAASQDEDAFNKALEAIEPRALAALAEFFNELQERGARLRVVEGDEDFNLDADAIGRAARRTEQTRIDVETLEEDGVLVGLVPQRRSFEWRRANGETIVGSVQADVARAYEESLFGDRFLLGPMRARFQVRSVVRRGGAPRRVFTLLQADPHE